MNLNITARHFEVTKELKEYIEKKFKKLEHYSHLIIKTDVILSEDSGQKLAEGKIGLRGNYIIAKTNTNEVYLTISLLADKLLRQIKTYDGKLKSKKRKARI